MSQPQGIYDPTNRESVYDYGRLALTSLITVCGGALIALMAYVGQVHRVSPQVACELDWAMISIGGSLFLALLASVFAYLNQFFLTFRKEAVGLWWVSIGATVLAISLLFVGGVHTFIGVSTAITGG